MKITALLAALSLCTSSLVAQEPRSEDDAGFLSSFLALPIATVSVEIARVGCGRSVIWAEEYEAIEEESLVPSLRDEVKRFESDREGSTRRHANGVDLDDLRWALREVNDFPDRAPSLADIGFNAGDIRAYRDRIAREIARVEECRRLSNEAELIYYRSSSPINEENRAIYEGITRRIDDIGPEIMRSVLSRKPPYTSRLRNIVYDITLQSESGDEIICTLYAGSGTSRHYMPWVIRAGEKHVKVYNLELSRLLSSLLPEDRQRDVRKEKVGLLYATATYLSGVGSK